MGIKLIMGILIFLFSLKAYAQKNVEGEIKYERKVFYSKMLNRATFMSQEDKDRQMLTWKNYDADVAQMHLYFNSDRSLYKNLTGEGNTEGMEDYNYRVTEFRIWRDFSLNRISELEEMLGKTYFIEDTLIAPKWKILNELKEIQGQLCMKASAYDTLRNESIIAWFAMDIPVSVGPEWEFGLPGLILELNKNDGEVIITATDIIFKEITNEMDFPKKIKAKNIDKKTYNMLITNYMKESQSMHRMPWAIRY